MQLPNELNSIQLERSVLGGFLNNKEFLIEMENKISERDFYNPVHSIIFSVLKNTTLSGQDINKVTLGQKIKDLKISKFNEIDIFDYLDTISFTQINLSGIKESVDELNKLRIKRELWINAADVQRFLQNSGSKSLSEIVSGVDSLNNAEISKTSHSDESVDLFAEAEDIISDRVKNPTKPGIQTPFEIYNEMFGGFRDGITAICGRAKNNKSTILLNMGFGSLLKDDNLSVLYIDTELKKFDHVFRSMAALAQFNPGYLEDGSWIKNEVLKSKLDDSWKIAKRLKGKLFHHYVGNRSVEEIVSIIRKWYYTKCGRGNRGLIIFDYIKIGNEKLSNHNSETQELGRKINTLNELSHQLSVPILSSMQLNRSAVIDQRDDESVISMTDRLSWFANGVFIFRKKRPDEISEEGLNYGSHKLIPVVNRYQGKNAKLLDWVNTSDNPKKPTYKPNFINYNFSHFLLEEKGTLIDIVKSKKLVTNLQPDKPSSTSTF